METRCHYCNFVIEVQDKYEFTCHRCKISTRRQRPDEYTITQMSRDFQVSRPKLQIIVKENNITPSQGTSASRKKEFYTTDQYNFIKSC